MTATTIAPLIGLPVASTRHAGSIRRRRGSSAFTEVREARRNRVLAISGLLTGLGAVTVAAAVAVIVSVTP